MALLLNPIGGKGKARQLVKTIALPILEAAGLKVEVYGTYCLLFKGRSRQSDLRETSYRRNAIRKTWGNDCAGPATRL